LAQAETGVYLGLLLLTVCSRRAKVLLVRTFQRYTLNPGHACGKTRRVPVGNGRKGDSFWIIAEHGARTGYVRNIQHDPDVRVGQIPIAGADRRSKHARGEFHDRNPPLSCVGDTGIEPVTFRV
jgi:F420H(2)-dependent quinone reductase